MGQGIVENVILLVDLNLKMGKTLLFWERTQNDFGWLIIDNFQQKSRLRDKVVQLTKRGH